LGHDEHHTARTRGHLDDPRLVDGDDERFTGYDAMGVPDADGHYLALRDMLATSIGLPTGRCGTARLRVAGSSSVGGQAWLDGVQLGGLGPLPQSPVCVDLCVRRRTMATNLAIDPDLLNHALAVSGVRTKKEAVTIALREFIARREQARIVESFGTLDWDESYDYKADRRSRDGRPGIPE
jgi:Arc/MetJ family transcription regulator